MILGGQAPDIGPTGDVVLHQVGAIGDADGAPVVGDGVLVARIVLQVLEGRRQVLGIGNIGVVQRLQHVQAHHARDLIAAGHDDIVLRGAAGFELGEHLVVAAVIVLVHGDAVLLGK